jgi:hypothetical protein
MTDDGSANVPVSAARPAAFGPSTPGPIGAGPDEPSGVIDQRGSGTRTPKGIEVTVDGPAADAAVVVEGVIVGDVPVAPADLDEVDRFVEALIEQARQEAAEPTEFIEEEEEA